LHYTAVMSDRESSIVAGREPADDDRRNSGDRRSERTPGRRVRRDPMRTLFGIATRDVAIILVCLAAIIVAIRFIHPIYSNQPTVVEKITETVPATKAVLAPTPADTDRLAQLVKSPQFETDRQAFAASLVKTGRMNQARADSISFYAVRESYRYGIPPAVVFGVMLTENALFVSSAMSNVGAVGLMQVYPKIWLKELRKKFGADLAADSTNLKYGIYILSTYIKHSSDSGGVAAGDLSKGLLRYNGCVHGTNTPNCRNYPSKVKTYVEKQGGPICGTKGFYDCIARPFIVGLFGKGLLGDRSPPDSAKTK
jgi:hypothetical protein